MVCPITGSRILRGREKASQRNGVRASSVRLCVSCGEDFKKLAQKATLRALCKTFNFPVTDNLYSNFFVAYSGKRWPGCCAAQIRTPRGPAQIPRETAGGTSDGGRSCGFPGKPRGGARGGSDHSSAKNRRQG